MTHGHGVDQLRGLVMATAAGLSVDQGLHVVAQTIPGLTDGFLMQLAEKGGGWVVLLMVLWFYRRDYKTLTTTDTEVRKELIAAIQRQSDSELKLSIALAENNEIMRRIVGGRRQLAADEEMVRGRRQFDVDER